MGRVWTFVIISVVIMLFLQLTPIQTGLDSLGSLVGFDLRERQFDIRNSCFYDLIFEQSDVSSTCGNFSTDISTGFLVGALGATIIIGFFVRSNPENYVILPFIFVLALFVTTFISVITYFNSLGESYAFMFYIVAILFGTFSVGYILSLVEFFRGSD